MDMGLFFLSWTPVVLLTVLAVVLRRSAMELSAWGFAWALVLAGVFYETPLSVCTMAALDGVLTTLPLLLVIMAGIFLSSLLMSTGSLVRIVEWFKGGAGDSLSRNLLITFGVGNFMEGAGVIAEPVVAPMLHTAGVSPTGAAALSIIGYAGLMSLELAGIIITVLALVTGLPVRELGMATTWLSIPATVLMALSAPLFLPAGPDSRRGFGMALAIGLLLGFAALGTVWLGGLPVSGSMAGVAVILLIILIGSGRLVLMGGILRDLLPFAFLITCLFSVNSIGYLRNLAFERLAIRVHLIPVHVITFRPLFSAYVYIFLAFLIAARLQRIPGKQLKEVIKTGIGKGWRAFAAMALFGAMGQVISYTGYGPGFGNLDKAHNIPWIISQGLVQFTGSLYPVFVPLLGWVGTFLTGYGVASLMLFGQLQIQAASLLGTSGTWLAAALAVGSSIGSISSPFKIALATAMVGAIGKEGSVLRITIPLGVAASLLVGGLVWIFA
ncbi:MAG: L-lactate permease [Pseudomonadota bacterium]